MVIKTFFFIFIGYSFFSYSEQAIAGECSQDQKIDYQSLNNNVAKLVSRVCYVADQGGYVETRITFRKNGKNQIVKNNFSGIAYVPDIDESIDFNRDGIPDLGIPNGEGRGGEGFDYWWYDSKAVTYKKLGKFSRLQIDKVHPEIFFYIVSGDEQYYARRYNYAFQLGKLKLKSVYGFRPCIKDKDCTEVVILHNDQQTGTKKNLLEKELEQCMAGTADCFERWSQK